MLGQLPFRDLYIICVYWSSGMMTTVQTQYSAVARREQVFSIIMHSVAAVVVGIVVSEISELLKSWDRHDTIAHSNMDNVRDYIRSRNIARNDPVLAKRVVRYFNYYYDKMAYDEEAILDSMDHNLRTELKKEKGRAPPPVQ